jgi:tRNA (uracil-5-)-methyltransferase TRM9
MDKQTAEKLIDKTRDDYNLIAEHFASTRRFNWSDTTEPIKKLGLKKGSYVLDLGCGNARLYELLKIYNIEYYGIDISDELVKMAKKNVPSGLFEIGDILCTPYRDNFFDSVISIAVIHHIPTDELREKAMREIYRITKPGGKIMLTAWYFWETSRYLKLIDRASKDELPIGDFYMPWKTGDGKTVTKRYFHAWKIDELHNAIRDAGFINIDVRQSSKFSGKPGYNLVATAEKPKK